jgi:hypothetical protein
MNIETLKEILINKLNAIRIQTSIATNEGRLEDVLKLADEEKDIQLIIDKLNK